MSKVYVFSGLVWALVGAVGGYVTPKIAGSQEVQPSVTVVQGVPGSAFPGTVVGYQGAGMFRVPSQAPYGTYQVVRGGTSQWGCTWTRLNSFDKKVGSRVEAGIIIGNNLSNLTIKKGDAGVWFQGDCAWRRIG